LLPRPLSLVPLLNRQVQQDGSVLVEQHDGKGVFLM
jgi:hypothetical protein